MGNELIQKGWLETINKILLILSVVITLAALLLILFSIPEFKTVFRDMGAQLPMLTQFVVDWYVILSGLTLLPFILSYLLFKRCKNSGVKVFLMTLFGEAIILSALIVPLYLPIYGSCFYLT